MPRFEFSSPFSHEVDEWLVHQITGINQDTVVARCRYDIGGVLQITDSNRYGDTWTLAKVLQEALLQFDTGVDKVMLFWTEAAAEHSGVAKITRENIVINTLEQLVDILKV